MDVIIIVIVAIIIITIIFVAMCLKILSGGRVCSDEQTSNDERVMYHGRTSIEIQMAAECQIPFLSETSDAVDGDDDKLSYDCGMSETLQVSNNDEQVINNDKKSVEIQLATEYQIPLILESSDDNDEDDGKLSYNWETSEALQMAKAFRISSDEESSDTSDDSLVPEPSISGIMEGTSYRSSSKRTTTVEENYIMDDMFSISNISDIRVSNATQRHEFAKERVERKGNIYDELYNACLKGQLSIIKDILETHNETLAPDELGQTPLYAACIGNHTDIIKLLTDFGYDVNHQDNEGKTPLHRIFENRDPDLAQNLITQFNASTEVRDAQNWTPLHTAIDQGYFDHSHDLNRKFFHQDLDTAVRWIQLHAACFEGRTKDVKVLLDASTDVNHVSSAGYTPLHVAVLKNNIDLSYSSCGSKCRCEQYDQQTPNSSSYRC